MDLVGQLSHLPHQLSRLLGRVQLLLEEGIPSPIDHRGAAGAPMPQTKTGTSVVGRVHRRLPPFDVAEVVRRYEAGESSRQLGRAYGVHSTTVLEHLERHGVARRAMKPKLDTEGVEEVARLYAGGLSLKVNLCSAKMLRVRGDVPARSRVCPFHRHVTRAWGV